MTENKQIFKCELCGNIVEVVHNGQGELVCCGKPMVLQIPKNEEEGLTEKHLPIIEKTETGSKVKLGSIPHPMEENHYIEWIEVETEDGKKCRKNLVAGEASEVNFASQDIVSARAYCNVHGLWKV